MLGEESSSIIYDAIISIGIGSIVAGGLIGIVKLGSKLRKNKSIKKE